MAQQVQSTTAQDQIKKLISNSNDSSMFLINLKAMESPRSPRPDEIPTLKEALATALENRPEIRQAMLDLKNKDIDVQYHEEPEKAVAGCQCQLQPERHRRHAEDSRKCARRNPRQR